MLGERLRRRNARKIDDHLFSDAIHRTLFDLIKEPTKFRPEAGQLLSYLQMAAQRDLQNLLDSENRHFAGRVGMDSVELSADARNTIWEVDDPLDAMITAEEAASVRRELLPQVRTGLSAEECACLELYLDCERKTEPYALALKIEMLPLDQQRHRVKQVKDMLKRRIKRGRSRHGE
jgi:hypothetical protein